MRLERQERPRKTHKTPGKPGAQRETDRLAVDVALCVAQHALQQSLISTSQKSVAPS